MHGIASMHATSMLNIDFVNYSMQAGVTTDEIDKAVHKMIIDNGAYPSPLTYGETLQSGFHLLKPLHILKTCMSARLAFRAYPATHSN